MKSIREKRDIELKRIVRDLWKMKHNHDNNIQMIVYDYLYMKVRQMQNKGILYDINITTVKQSDR